MLYIRMVISMVVGFYTSRVVLQTLGVIDYGIYGLVGGIISMLGFLNTSLSNASSRFITFEVGIGKLDKIGQVFNSSVQAHCLVALIIFFVAETFGLWIVNDYLVIPKGRMHVANIIFQISIISTIISILQVPYSSLVIAHERMDVFAWLEILNVSLKLIIVSFIRILPYEPIVSYGVLSLIVSLSIIAIYCIYCHHHFSESSLSLQWYPSCFRRLLSFSGFIIFADFSSSFRSQGINILINRFFGVVLNASCSVATMVQGAVWLCGHNVLAAFQPQIIKQFAVGNIPGMQRMLGLALQYTLLLSVLFTIPSILCMPFLLRFWLGEVPEYAVSFCRLLLLDNLLGLVNHVITIGIYAQTRIELFSVINGIIKCLCLPAIYILLSFHLDPDIPYLFCLIVLPFVFGINLYLLKYYIPFIHISVLLKYISRPLLLIVVSAIVILPLFFLLNQGWVQFFSITFSFVILLMAGCYIWILDSQSREWVRGVLCFHK